ncbi:hypothetical protein AB0903_20030 [Streptomyces sp. NPDC048389]|uniref:hypothetical protein n=1 Tax=Streptomyces sp. NPDC048389 TaxID=3154622 RepID=UPI0034572F1C
MNEDHGSEPVFVRSKWGTSRYVYNPNSPVGMALIVGSLLFAAVGLFSLHDSSSWSEGELHDAVHSAAESLDARPQRVGGFRGSYEELIADAIENSGEGPEFAMVGVSPRSDTKDDTSVDRFEITTDDVDDSYCMSVSPPEPDTFTSVTVTLGVSVEAGDC